MIWGETHYFRKHSHTFKVGVFWQKNCPPNTHHASKDGRSKPGTRSVSIDKNVTNGRWAMKKKTRQLFAGKKCRGWNPQICGDFFINHEIIRDPGSPLNNMERHWFSFGGSEPVEWIYIHGLKSDPRNLKIVILANLENRPFPKKPS